MSGLFRDMCCTEGQLRSRPGFTIVCVLTLALGVGASTAIFGVVNPIGFEPFPYPDASQIFVERSRSFEAMTAFQPWQPVMTGGGQPERLEGQAVSASLLHVIGVAPFLGRDFKAAEDVFHGPKVEIDPIVTLRYE